MIRRTWFAPAAVVSLALFASACGSTSTPASSTSTNGLTTDTLSGTVPVGGSDFKPFTTTLTGETDVTLTSVTPAVAMGLAIGLPGGPGCVPINANASTTASPGTTAQLAGELTPGTFCVLISDVGNLTTAASYTVTVVHP